MPDNVDGDVKPQFKIKYYYDQNVQVLEFYFIDLFEYGSVFSHGCLLAVIRPSSLGRNSVYTVNIV